MLNIVRRFLLYFSAFFYVLTLFSQRFYIHVSYTWGDSDEISFQLVFTAILWVKLMFPSPTLLSLKYALSVGQ